MRIVLNHARLGYKRFRQRNEIGVSGCVQHRFLQAVYVTATSMEDKNVIDPCHPKSSVPIESNRLPETYNKASYPPHTQLQEILKQAGFTIFHSVSDLGFYGWRPKGSYPSLSTMTVDEFKTSVELDTRPKQIADVTTMRPNLPIKFEKLVFDKCDTICPLGQYKIAGIYVALKDRNVKKETIDFLFCGSALEMFANASLGRGQFFVTIVPGTNVIMVTKSIDYIQNYSSVGYQLERLATGEKCSDRSDTVCIEHLQILKLAGHNVLFSAEVDAIDTNGNPVEIKASNPLYWGTRTMFQMISSGVIHLFQGVKSHGRLVDVYLVRLDEIIRDAQLRANIKTLEHNITSGLVVLLEVARNGRLKHGKVMAITFVGTSLELVECIYQGNCNPVFPSLDVLRTLLT